MRSNVFLLLIFLQIFSNAQELKLNHISQKGGFNSSHITCISQDKEGYVWIGTQYGLFRHDGLSFRKYEHNDSSNSLPHNNIINIYEHTDGKLWISTSGGVGVYDKEKDFFINYFHDPDDSTSLKNNLVSEIVTDENGIFWLATYDGLVSYHPNTNIFKHYPYPFIDSIPDEMNSYTVSVEVDNDGMVWVGSFYAGMYSFDIETEKFTAYFQPDLFCDKNKAFGVNKIYCDEENVVWGACWGQGLYRISNDRKKSEIIKFSVQAGVHDTHRINQLKNLQPEGECLWISTEFGIIHFNKITREYIHYPKTNKTNGLRSRVVSVIFIDKDDGMWIGAGGLSYFNPSVKVFNYTLFKDILGKEFTYDFNRRNNAKVYGNYFEISTYQGEAFLIDRFNFKLHSKKDQSGGSNIFIDSKGVIWRWNELGELRLEKSENFNNKVLLPDLSFYKTQPIGSIIEDRKGNIWISNTDFIFCYSYKHRGAITFTETIYPVKLQTLIGYKHKLFLSKNDEIYNQFTNGAFGKFIVNDTSIIGSDFQVGKVYDENYYKVIEIANITNIDNAIEKDTGVFYVTNASGLYKIDARTLEVKKYHTRTSYPALDLIYLDSEGILWAYSNSELLAIDFENNTHKFLTIDDGLSGNKIFASTIFDDGEVLLIDDFGVTSFFPGEIHFNKNIPDVVLTGFRLHGHVVSVSSEASKNNEGFRIQKDINFIEELKLKYNQNTLSFSYAALNYRNPHLNNYKVYLEGHDKDWMDVGNTNEVVYSNLAPGRYILKIKASNNHGVWTPQARTLNIHITPPLWNTIVFKVLLLFLISFILLSIYRYRVRSFGIRQAELEREVRSRTADIEQQKEEMEMQADNLKETNEILVEQQAEIQAQSEALHTSNKELQKLNETKDKFFSIIAHDLKNPLHAIKGLSDLLFANYAQIEDEKRLSFIKMINDSTNQVSGLLMNLLNWSRAESNTINAKPLLHNLSLIVSEVINLLKSTAEAKRISLVNDVNKDVIVYTDVNMLNTIIRNIVSNGIKFTAKGGKVCISAIQSKDSVQISIADTGVGMSPDKAKKMFLHSNLESSKGTEGEEGTGLGLLVCKQFIEANNGCISVESSLGKGTTFNLSLPAKDGVAINLEKPIEEEQKDNLTALLEKESGFTSLIHYKVLIVEDSFANRASLKAALEAKYKVMEAENGNEALELIKKVMPDLIISDIMMPEMDGEELCKIVKSNPVTSHIPMIMLTAKTLKNSKIRAFKYGADEYLHKPFDKEILLGRVDNLLSKTEQLKDKFIRDISAQTAIDGMKKSEQDFLNKAINIVKENMENPDFSIEHFSEKMNMHRRALYGKLKSLTNQNPTQFIRIIRLKEAAKLLKEEQLSVSEVYSRVGFANRSYFSTSFTQFFGCSPREFVQKD